MKLRSRFSLSIVVCALIVLLPFLVTAQKRKPNAVFLKNGEIVKGKILEHDGALGVKVENDCGVWLFNPSEFDSTGYRHFKKISISQQIKNKGYYNLSYFGANFGSEDVPIPVIASINGYHHNPQFFTGVGLGYEYYDFGVMPLFADIRYFVFDERVSPFLSFQTGYGFAVENIKTNSWRWSSGYINETFGGFLLGTSAGINFRVSEHGSFNFSLGYRYQKLSYSEQNFDGARPYHRRVYTIYNRVSFTLGFLFL